MRNDAGVAWHRGEVNRRPRIRPAYVVGIHDLHHFVIIRRDGESPEGGPPRALCGARVDGIDERRPLWKAGGHPCPHCIRVFDAEGLTGLAGGDFSAEQIARLMSHAPEE
jgi:hypothetical protein